ncbi:hypothetical protein XENORESO_010765 [Xenotaenia resolanae]|uniref:Uncharacterized protein n=1 Tax=Xenotaenia resolanae TaxID=208358 RepID=A0ABV0VW77_9TELE
MCGQIKKITCFGRSNRLRCLDRANELNTFSIGSVQKLAQHTPLLSTGIPPSIDPKCFCHVFSTSAMDPSGPTCFSLTQSEDADAPFPYPFCSSNKAAGPDGVS